MTLRVVKILGVNKGSWGSIDNIDLDNILEEPEANAARGGGNDIYIRSEGISRSRRYGGLDQLIISLKNNNFRVDITHKTALNLIGELLNYNNSEYAIYNEIESRLKYDMLRYSKLWRNLNDTDYA